MKYHWVKLKPLKKKCWFPEEYKCIYLSWEQKLIVYKNINLNNQTIMLLLNYIPEL